ncbi:MAG: AarF/ABC1/UbiB kinase family protein [Candidatus Pacebacteria bacterium]|nr:AarF/ABC1/UbiB kinase family protein [Candidatus Paceibacterota bacterium]
MNVNVFRRITRTYWRMQRYRDIAGVLIRHGYGDVVSRLGLQRYLPFHRRKHEAEPSVAVLSRYTRIRLALEELGPTFIKFGQLLSTRHDILPEDLIQELEKLQDEVPPFPGDQAKRIVEDELGKPVADLFRRFNEQPLASASIAQVHEAETIDGNSVAVKIRRPDIRRNVERDLDIMAHLAILTERMIEETHVFDLQRLVEQFARMIRKEMDFSLEAVSIQRFGRAFEKDPRLYVLTVYNRLSTERVLTMEYVQGVKVSHTEKFSRYGLDPEVVAERGAQLALEQVFRLGFFHADPHPGNILVMPGNVLCLLDYGTMGSLSERDREHLSKLIIGFVEHDERRVTNAVFQIAGYTNYAKTGDLEGDIANFIDDQLYRPLGRMNIGHVLSELSKLLIRHNIYLPPTFFLMIKCFTTVESIGRMLVPDFDLLAYLQPFAKKLVRERIDIKKTVRDAYLTAADFRLLVRDMPTEIRQIVGLFKHGDLGFKFEHKGLDKLKQTFDQTSNRLTFGIVLAALIVGSSIMVLSGIPPTWHEIPIIGVVGFVLSGLMGFSLLYSMVKHGKM